MEIRRSEGVGRATSGVAPGRGPLRVVCFSTYVSDPGCQEAHHRDVGNFLLALRGERIDGESRVTVATEERLLTATNANDSIDWFGEMVVDYLKDNQPRPAFSIVPVPTPHTTLELSAGPWTSLLAISIVSNGLDGGSVVDALRWRAALPAPGQRALTASELYDNLALTRKLEPTVPVILVDYLYTGSATLRACAGRLQEQGIDVSLALCAGRTAEQPAHGPFTVVVGEISPFVPGH